MPGGDGTGPWGQGPMTGRGLGYCSGNNAPGWTVPGPGRGMGYGRGRGGYGLGLGLRRGWGGGRGGGWGRGRGFGRWGAPIGWVGYPPAVPAPAGVPNFGTAPTKEQVLADLEAAKNYFNGQLADIDQEIERVKNTPENASSGGNTP